MKYNIWFNFFLWADNIGTVRADLKDNIDFIICLGERNGFHKSAMLDWYRESKLIYRYKTFIEEASDNEKTCIGIPLHQAITDRLD